MIIISYSLDIIYSLYFYKQGCEEGGGGCSFPGHQKREGYTTVVCVSSRANAKLCLFKHVLLMLSALHSGYVNIVMQMVYTGCKQVKDDN